MSSLQEKSQLKELAIIENVDYLNDNYLPLANSVVDNSGPLIKILTNICEFPYNKKYRKFKVSAFSNLASALIIQKIFTENLNFHIQTEHKNEEGDIPYFIQEFNVESSIHTLHLLTALQWIKNDQEINSLDSLNKINKINTIISNQTKLRDEVLLQNNLLRVFHHRKHDLSHYNIQNEESIDYWFNRVWSIEPAYRDRLCPVLVSILSHVINILDSDQLLSLSRHDYENKLNIAGFSPFGLLLSLGFKIGETTIFIHRDHNPKLFDPKKISSSFQNIIQRIQNKTLAFNQIRNNQRIDALQNRQDKVKNNTNNNNNSTNTNNNEAIILSRLNEIRLNEWIGRQELIVLKEKYGSPLCIEWSILGWSGKASSTPLYSYPAVKDFKLRRWRAYVEKNNKESNGQFALYLQCLGTDEANGPSLFPEMSTENPAKVLIFGSVLHRLYKYPVVSADDHPDKLFHNGKFCKENNTLGWANFNNLTELHRLGAYDIKEDQITFRVIFAINDSIH